MGDRPVYPKQLDPKGWESAKGTLAKAVIKADVKGALEKAAKGYWGLQWEALEDAANSSLPILRAATDKVLVVKALVEAVESNAAVGLVQIDKIPANKLAMKASRAYLDQMRIAAKGFADELQRLINEAQSTFGKARAVEIQASSGFDGWLKVHAAKTEEIVKECQMRIKAAKGALLGLRGDTKETMKTRELGNVDGYIGALNTVYQEGETKYKALNAGEQKQMLNAWFKFKATQPSQLKVMKDEKAELSSK